MVEEVWLLVLRCDTGPFLRSWMPEIVTLGHSKVFLMLLINLVHFSAAYLDGEVLVGVVR